MHNKIYLDLALIGLLLLASAFDLGRRRIPNRLLAIGLLAALVLHLSSAHPAALLSTYLAGFALGLVMFLPLYLLGGMAAGDVKLMATVGAFLGPALVFQASLATYCAGGVMALLIVLARGRSRAAFANVGALLHPLLMRLGGVRLAPDTPAESVGGMPYAVAITLGTLLVMCLHHS
ncbi:MAG: prepilin peptidase [Pseudomonadota bacterium]